MSHQQANLPQIYHLLERDVGIIVAAPLAAIFRCVTAVAKQKCVGVRVVVLVEEAFDALQDVASLKHELLWESVEDAKSDTTLRTSSIPQKLRSEFAISGRETLLELHHSLETK